jgi:hypothetical protein
MTQQFYYSIRNEIVKEVNEELIGKGFPITNANQIEALEALQKTASKSHGEKLRAKVMDDMISAMVMDSNLVYFSGFGSSLSLDIEAHKETVREWTCNSISHGIENSGMDLQTMRAYQVVHIRHKAKTLMYEKPILLSAIDELATLNVYTEMLLELHLNPESYFTMTRHHLGGEN